MAVETIPVDMDAARVCFAISKIGYSPASALMDIVDNSVAAGAKNVVIEIDLCKDTTYAQKNNVSKYRIIDDGCGMSNDKIKDALRLGSRADYGEESLSKYGMGLKSAGFSLGSCICVVSKTDNQFSARNCLDRSIIERRGKYVITREPLNEAEKHYNKLLETSPSGTVIEISGCENVDQHSARRTVDHLQEKLGVTYFKFLKAGKLSISIQCTSKPLVHIQPKDILFLQDAVDGFDEDQYDGKRPCWVIKEEKIFPKKRNAEPIVLDAVIFPQAQMANYAEFAKEERERIGRYGVSRKDKGFFIYRNGRLIKWGDDLDGLVARDKPGFRARLLINSSHDDILHVDVSKQRLSMPEDVIDQVELVVRNALKDHDQAFKRCGELMKHDVKPGHEFNRRNQDLAIEDYEEPTGQMNKEELDKRKKKLAEETKKRLDEEGEFEPPTLSEVTEIPIFERVRYSDKVKTTNFWEAGTHPTDGEFVRINENHAFFETVLNNLGEGEPSRQAIEALLWVLAAAEVRTFTNLPKIQADVIERVLKKFKSIASFNLDSWCARNQDMFNA